MTVKEVEQKPDEAAPPDFELISLKSSFDAFGRLVDFLSRIEPFARYDMGNFSRALQLQLGQGCHVAALSGTTLIGYCGWLPTTHAIATAWVEGRGALTPAGASVADAVVLTVIASPNREVLNALIRRARELNPGRRVHFKRQYVEKGRPPRKSSVRNVRL